MKVSFTILFFLLSTILASGQDYGLQTKMINENYTLINKTVQQLDSFYFDLQPIQNTKFITHFRISLLGQTIDFYSADNIKFQGKLTNYITEYVSIKNKNSDYNRNKEYQYIIEQIDLEQSKVDRFVVNLIKTGQPEIAMDNIISNWQSNFLHCNNLFFQFYINGKYTQQIFHCPWGQQDSVEYKNIVLNNYQTLKSTFLLDSLYDIFIGKLPNGKTYSSDGYRMMFKITERQVNYLKKNQAQRDFMKSIKDSVDNYFNSELEKLNIELDGFNCFKDYRLIFGMNGKLNTIKLSHYNKSSLKKSLGLVDYLADKKENRICKKKIKQLFSKIDLGFLNLECKIYRTLSFGLNKEIQLRDNTIY